MIKYKIESIFLEFPLYIETESNKEAYEAFVAMCDYNGVDEDEIECMYDDEYNITSSMAWLPNSEKEEPDFKFTKIK